MDIEALNQALGLPEGTPEDGAIAAVLKLSVERDTLRARLQRVEIDAFLDSDAARARVTPALRDRLVAMGLRSLEEMKSFVAALPTVPGAPVLSASSRAHTKELGAPSPEYMTQLTDADRAFCTEQEIDPAEYAQFKASREKALKRGSDR